MALASTHQPCYWSRRPGLEVIRRYYAGLCRDLDGAEALRFFSGSICEEAPWISFGPLPAAAPPGSVQFRLQGYEQKPLWQSWCDELQVQPVLPRAQDRPTGRKLVLAPGSGSARKNWPREFFLQLLQRCFAAWDIHILLGPAELDRGEADFWRGCELELIVEECQEIDKAVACLYDANYYLGCDSGLSHLAGLHAIPGVVIFQASDPCIWKPWFSGLVVAGDEQGPPALETVEELIRASQ